jgi:hypothetical protein
MTAYLLRLAGGRGPDTLAPSGRSRSPLSGQDQRLDLPGFPEASLLGLEPSIAAGPFEQPSGIAPAPPTVSRVGEAGAQPNELREQFGNQRPEGSVHPPRAGAPDVVRTEVIETRAARSVGSPPDPVSAAIVRIAESIRRENTHAVVPQGPAKQDRTTRHTSIELAPQSGLPAPRGIEPAPRQKLAEAPLPIASGPIVEIGAIHVEVVRPALKPSRELAAPKPRASTNRAASRTDASRPIRSKLRFGLRQL